MNVKQMLFSYGESVPGYEVGMINEREVRAAAGIMFALGMMVIFIGIGFGHIIVARVFLAFLFVDFTIRLFTPRYAPSLLLGRVFVQNQTPEYVGALQKRFAWTLGWLISLPLMWWFVLHWDITFYKVSLCLLCLIMTFMESAFSFCLGCWLYEKVFRKDPHYCPGGVCEIRQKEPIQTFSLAQKVIASSLLVGLVVGTYLFITKTESKTFFGQFLYEKFLTQEQLQKAEDEAFEKASQSDFDDEDDDF